MLEFSEILPKSASAWNGICARGISPAADPRHRGDAARQDPDRVGNDEYARENRSFGLTTLRGRHVEIKGAKMRFSFRGKSGVDHTVSITDRRLARIIQQCQDLPGYELFKYTTPPASARPSPRTT